jgi:hypothetical protein
MDTRKAKAAALAGANGFGTQQEQEQFTASPASFVKWLTIGRYSHGFLSVDGCNAAFAAHPDWRRA